MTSYAQVPPAPVFCMLLCTTESMLEVVIISYAADSLKLSYWGDVGYHVPAVFQVWKNTIHEKSHSSIFV